MKQILLFAILALSINAFAQSKRPVPVMQQPSTHSSESIQGSIEDGGLKTPDICSIINSARTANHQPLTPRELIMILDSIYTWQWDTLSTGWKIGIKYIDMAYDAKHNLTGYRGLSWNGSGWENSFKITFTYDASNNQTSYLSQRWDSTAWVNSWLYSYTFDARNNRLSSLSQVWDGSAWVNSSITTNTYDASDNRTHYLRQRWTNGAWVNSYQSTYTFNVSNKLTSTLGQSWNGSDWVNSTQGTYIYDANNNLTNLFVQNWYDTAWVNSYRSTYTYNANNDPVSILAQNWYDTVWVNSYLIGYTYDANNNQTSESQQVWNDVAWVNYYQYNYTYDANNFIQSESYKYWNNVGTKVEFGDSTYYYFHTIIGINDLVAQEGAIHVYPNPCSGKFTISSNSRISSVEIYNLTGELICADDKFNLQNSKKIDLSGFAKGIYIIKLSDGLNSYKRKIVVQ
jgi:hypothetical protein